MKTNTAGWRSGVLCLLSAMAAGMAAEGRAGEPPAFHRGGAAERSAREDGLRSGLLRLAAEADRVLLATCLEVQDDPHGAPGASPFASATFRIEETFKGPDRKQLTLRHARQAPGDASKVPGPDPPLSGDEEARYGPPADPRGSRRELEGSRHGMDPPRRERLDGLRHLPAARPGSHPAVAGPSLAFRAGERVLLFLPAMDERGSLTGGAAGFAELLVVTAGRGPESHLIPVAGPDWLTAPAVPLGQDAPTAHELLDALRKEMEPREPGAAPGRRHATGRGRP